MSVGQGQHRQLFAFEERLDHDLAPGVAEAPSSSMCDRAARLLAGLAHHGALSSREARCLDDERVGMAVA